MFMMYHRRTWGAEAVEATAGGARQVRDSSSYPRNEHGTKRVRINVDISEQMQGISKKSTGPAGGYSQFDTIAMRFRVSVVTISVTISNAAGLRVSFAAKGSVSWLVSHSAIVFPLLSIHCRLHLSACMTNTRPAGAPQAAVESVFATCTLWHSARRSNVI